MSTTIDQNVVEMRFDNSHFEKNVSTSMSTLDKLKQKLRFDGATKGLENVSSAANKVNMTGLGNGVETVKAKFSAMEVVGVTALANITNSAVNAGKRIVSALTIDPVKTGFNEYEMKMDSIKTIVNSTGRDLEDVNKLLEELNEYSDQTIYSFRDMTQNIGKFTNAGVKLEDAVLAIKGISNEAAVSGANANEASRAMYNFSQALSAGYVKLIDWKSIENANMATKEFKQQLIDTAVELGVVTQEGEMYVTSTGKSFNATKNFNEVLQEQWMTTDVLIKTLGKYADENTEIGKKAFAAAQEVTKFTQMWDVLKETAQSGWAKTWEIIVGDLNSAKAVLTPLTNFFSKIIDTMSDARNRVLEIALNFAEPWKVISEKLSGLKDVVKTVKTVTKPLEYFQDVVTKVWRGDYNNHGDAEDRYDLLTKAGYDWRVVQDLVNKGYQYKITMEDVAASHKKFGLTMETTTEETKEVAASINNLSDARLKEAGLTEDEIKLYRALQQEANRAGISIEQLAKEMSETTGRDLLIESAKNIGSVFVGIGKAIKEAWVGIFNPPGLEEMGIRLYGITRSIRDFTESLRLTDKETGELNETGLKFQSIFRGIFAAIDIVVTIISGPLKLAFKIITQLLSYFGVGVLDVAALVGEGIVKLRDWLDAVLDFTWAFDLIIPPIQNAIETFKEWIANLKESENLPQDIAKGIANAFGKAFETVKNFFKKIPSFFENGMSVFKNTPLEEFANKVAKGFRIAGEVILEFGKIILNKLNEFLSARGFKTISEDSIAGFVNGFKEGAVKVWNAAVDMAKQLVQRVKDFLGIHSPSKVFFAIGGFIVAGLIAGLQNGIPDSLGAVKDLFQPMLDWINGLDFGAILAGVFTVGTTASIYKAVDAVHNISKAFGGFGEILEESAKFIDGLKDSITRVSKAVAFEMKMEGFKQLAIALLVLVGAIAILTLLDPKKMWIAVGAISVLIAVVATIAILMSRLSAASAKFDFKKGLEFNGLATSISSLGVVILMLGITAAILAKLGDGLVPGLASLGAILVALMVVMGVMTKISKGANAMSIKTITELGKMLKKLASALLVMSVVVWILGTMNINKLIQGGIAIAVFGGIIVGLMAATRLFGEKDAESVGKMMKSLGASLLLMSVAVLILGNMDPIKLLQGGAAVVAFGGIVVGLIAATKLIGNDADKVAKAILGISGAIAIMGLTAFMLSMISWDAFWKGTLMIAAFSGMIVGLIAATKLVDKDADKAGKAMLGIAGAIAIMGFTAVMLSMISWDAFWKGTLMIAAFSAMIVGLIWATLLVGNNADKMGKTILGIAGAIAILGLTAVLLSLVDPENMKRGLIIVGILTLLVAGLIAVTYFSKDCMKTMIAIAAVIAVLGGIVFLISKIPAESAIVSGSVLAGLLVVMTGVLWAASAIAKKAGDALKGVLLLIGMAVVLLSLVDVLAEMQNVQNARINAIILAQLAAAMTALMIPLTILGNFAGKAAKGVLVLTLTALPLIAFVGVLAAMQNVQNATANTIYLTNMAVAMTLLLVPLAIIGNFATQALMGVLALTAMALPLIAFVGVLAAMQNVQVATANVQALIDLATAMTLLLIPLTIVGAFGMTGAPYLGVLALLAMAVPMVAFVGIIALMSGIQNGIANAKALTELMTAMGDVLFKLALVAPLAAIAVVAVAALVVVIGVVGVLATAIGALVTTFPQLQTFIDVGIEILVKLAEGLGRVIGSFVAAIAEEIMQTLPTLGACLSQFMINATPFIMGAKLIDDSVLTGIKTLVEAILMLTAADVLQGLISWISGGSPLENFTKQLPILGEGLAAFSASLGSFTEEQLNTVNCAANAIKTLASASAEIPNTGGLLASIVGENDLSAFANQFPVLGSGLALFLSNIGTFSDEQVSTVNCAANAIKSLATAASEIPNSGGWVGAIVGENDLDAFAAKFPTLGSGLALFLRNVGTFTEEQVATVDCSAQAIKLLATAASEIPNSGGWVGAIVGNNDLQSFSAQFPYLGTALAMFLQNVGTFTADQVATVNCAADAVVSLANVANKIPNSGGWVGAIVGENDLGTFASNFPKLGQGLKGFVNNIGTFTAEQVTSINSALDAVRAIADLGKSNLSGLSANIGGISGKLPNLGKNIKTFCTNMPSESSVKSAVSGLDKIVDAAKTISSVDSGPLKNFVNNLGKIGKDAVKKFVEAFTSNSTKTDLSNAAKTLGDKVVDGLEAKEKAVKTAGTDVAKKAVDGLESQDNEAEDAGKNLGAGYVKGVKAKKQAAYDAGYAVGKAGAQGINDGQKSKSPSRLAMQSGKWLGEGYIIGIGKMGRQVDAAGNNLGDTATKSLSSSISRIANLVNTDIDSQPTIRPVLDLSDVRAGASAMSNMLNMDSRVGVMANVGTISSMMNSRGQNGANNDVVSAINALNKKLDNVGSTSYNINGITYDDGSNITEAVRTIVRAAQIERRV